MTDTDIASAWGRKCDPLQKDELCLLFNRDNGGWFYAQSGHLRYQQISANLICSNKKIKFNNYKVPPLSWFKQGHISIAVHFWKVRGEG